MSPGLVYPPTDLDTYLVPMGKGWCYVGDMFQVGGGGMTFLGATEGDVAVALNEEYNVLTFPEYTGPSEEEVEMTGEKPVATIPLIVGNSALWAKINPLGTRGGGSNTHTPVVYTGLAIIPESEVSGGLSYNGTVWAPAAPTNAIWFPRGYFTSPGPTYGQSEGGKRIISVAFHACRDATRPAGSQTHYIGNPVTVWPDFRL